MDRWYTSDHHFGHSNIIRYCGRPFVDADAMDKEMVARWNDVVADEDEVWILGDLVMGKKDQGLANHVARLRGRKVLVPGNHDRCWQGHKDHRWERADYYRIGGIAKIIDNPEPHTIAGQAVRLSHFPYKLDDRHDMKYTQWRPQDDGGWLLHGHVHEKWSQQHRQINVGVDAWNFAPVPEQTIADLIKRGPSNTPIADHTGAPARAQGGGRNELSIQVYDGGGVRIEAAA
ncbi:metallophosphoesterase [Candidatus Poriferisocius sp.]|uniref:metallophosphoesterase n=1 Tax=Candidatus Poriferisocius sp. TaxID=3101276 RepID=UPI003B017AC7